MLPTASSWTCCSPTLCLWRKLNLVPNWSTSTSITSSSCRFPSKRWESTKWVIIRIYCFLHCVSYKLHGLPNMRAESLETYEAISDVSRRSGVCSANLCKLSVCFRRQKECRLIWNIMNNVWHFYSSNLQKDYSWNPLKTISLENRPTTFLSNLLSWYYSQWHLHFTCFSILE